MTKVEAIAKVMEANGGTASLKTIYDQIEQYYPAAKQSRDWSAGLRGVLYRELKYGSLFKKIGLSIYALSDYKEEAAPKEKEKVRMHSYMEGLCIELGNSRGYNTFTADPSQLFRDNLPLQAFTTLDELPPFTYEGVLHDTRLIDVLWFSNKRYAYPQYAFEVVDSIGTLAGAFNRCLQLQNFRTKFFVVAPEKHYEKYCRTIEMDVYSLHRDRFEFLTYDKLKETYSNIVGGAKEIGWLL